MAGPSSAGEEGEEQAQVGQRHAALDVRHGAQRVDLALDKGPRVYVVRRAARGRGGGRGGRVGWWWVEAGAAREAVSICEAQTATSCADPGVRLCVRPWSGSGGRKGARRAHVSVSKWSSAAP